MDIFWFLMGFLLIIIAVAIAGTKDLCRGRKFEGYFQIFLANLLVLLVGYLLYLDGLFYASGQPLTIYKLFFN